jgi:hypothetical protein
LLAVAPAGAESWVAAFAPVESVEVTAVDVLVADVTVEDDPVAAKAADPIARVRTMVATGTTHLLFKNPFTRVLLSLGAVSSVAR